LPVLCSEITEFEIACTEKVRKGEVRFGKESEANFKRGQGRSSRKSQRQRGAWNLQASQSKTVSPHEFGRDNKAKLMNKRSKTGEEESILPPETWIQSAEPPLL